jgi:hypothetical protein
MHGMLNYFCLLFMIAMLITLSMLIHIFILQNPFSIQTILLYQPYPKYVITHLF